MRTSLLLPVAALALTTLPALADSTYTFTFTDQTTGYGSVTFSVDPSTAISPMYSSDFTFSNISGTENGAAASLTLEINPGGGEDLVELYDSDYTMDIYGVFGPAFALGDPGSGGSLTLIPGMSSGYDESLCAAQLRSPFVRSALPTTLAFFQLQSPFQINCGDVIGLTVSQKALTPPPPTTGVTPEPSSFALLGTGLLGAAGVMRRRLRC